MSAWEDSYVGGLRAVVGDRILITVGARCVVRDDEGRVLLIRRRDNGIWALPAGSMELGDTLAQNAAREVFEETGLTTTGITPFALYTNVDPKPDMYGQRYQHVTMAGRVDGWTGELVKETDETTDAAWYAPDELPEGTSKNVARTLADLAAFESTGHFTMQ